MEWHRTVWNGMVPNCMSLRELVVNYFVLGHDIHRCMGYFNNFNSYKQ